MALRLDHVVIAVTDLDQAMQDYHAQGYTVRAGGIHANGATHNALICFADGTYIELLALTGQEPFPGLLDFSVLCRDRRGLVGYALGSDDLLEECTRLIEAGIGVGEISPGERKRADGTLIRWRLMQVESGFAPFLIQDLTSRNLRVSDDPEVTSHLNRAVGIRGIEIAVRSMDEALERYTGLTGTAPSAGNTQNYAEIVLDSGRLILVHPPVDLDKLLPDGAAEALYEVKLNWEAGSRRNMDVR
jgi:hypothetical protein